MASVNQGRGKTKFREFSKSLTQAYRDLIDSIEEGEEYFSDDVIDYFNQLYLVYIQELTDEEIPNIELWGKRASELITKRITQVFDKFGEGEERPTEEEKTDEEEPFIDEDRGFITIRGDDYPIITRSEAPTMRRAGRTPRNKVFRTLEELESYLYDVDWPREYIQLYGGIEIIRRATQIVGYRIWIG